LIIIDLDDESSKGQERKQVFSCAMGLPLCFSWGKKKKKKV
jgi:hypothetical protein